MVVSNIFYFHPYLGKIPNFLLIFFNWVETTNQNIIKHFYLGKLQENWDAQGLSDRRACLAIILAATWHKTDGFLEVVRYLVFNPGDMIQFDLRIFFNWVGEKPPTRT